MVPLMAGDDLGQSNRGELSSQMSITAKYEKAGVAK
jgi:hypothetical protein